MHPDARPTSRLSRLMQAKFQAAEEARRIPWPLLLEAREQFVDWSEFECWANAVLEVEGLVPDWLEQQIEERCPGFWEFDSESSGKGAQAEFGTPGRLREWITEHVFGYAVKGGWFNAIAYYAMQETRYQKASAYRLECITNWRRDKAVKYPTLSEWLAAAAHCDETVGMDPRDRRMRRKMRRVGDQSFAEAVSQYKEWEAWSYWVRSPLGQAPPMPDNVESSIERLCPGFLAFNGAARIDASTVDEDADWHRLMSWIDQHFFADAVENEWISAIWEVVRRDPRAERTMNYWYHCDKIWSVNLPKPYPSFESWRRDADKFVDLSDE